MTPEDSEQQTATAAAASPLLLTGQKTGARLLFIPPSPSAEHASSFLLKIKNKKTATEVILTGALFFLGRDDFALRFFNEKISFYHYKTIYRGTPIFDLSLDAQNNAWRITNTAGKTARLDRGAIISEFEPEQFICAFPDDAEVADWDAAGNTAPAPTKNTANGGATTDYNVTVVRAEAAPVSPDDFRGLQSELLEYIREKSYIENPPSVFPEHEKDWGKTFRHNTDGATPIWFIGDVHGDLLALKILTDFAFAHDRDPSSPHPLQSNKNTQLFFLGDFIDRGKFSAEVVAWVMGTAAGKTFGGKRFDVMAVIGNHDAALSFDDYREKFSSEVAPSEFFGQLNSNPAAFPFGEAAVAFFQKLPVMVLFDEALMAVHGGLPHPACFGCVDTREQLHNPLLLPDFFWARLHKTLPRKQFYHRSAGAELGIEDFNEAVSKLGDAAIYGVSPKIIVRGHEHENDNFAHYTNYKKYALVTLNAMTQRRVLSDFRPQKLAIARWCPAEPLSLFVYTLEVSANTVDSTLNNSRIATIISRKVLK
ncbi:MAG: metallophosphoesterase [Puniceicoccales bacterium]|jgi:hypothetical protein|nr:metallophosphoesterase [Puniceicoccales bacterium]